MFVRDSKSPMLQRDKEHKLLKIQNNSVIDIYDTNDFVLKCNNVLALINPDNNPNIFEFYINALIVDSDKYNKMCELKTEMWKQFKTGLTGELKMATLPVVIPDGEYFIQRFKEAKANYERTSNSKQFQKTIEEDANLFLSALGYSVEANKQCAKNHNVAINKISGKNL